MKKNVFIFVLLSYIMLSIELQATPVIANQQKMKCNACHTMMPALNSTGQRFLRKGLRFSKNDPTMIDSFIKPDGNETRILPFAGLVGLNIDSKNRQDVEKVNLYFSGTLSENLSVYALTRSTYNAKYNHNLFSPTNSRAYFQYNLNDTAHVFKVGYMNPFTQFLNIDRMIMDNSLMGSGLAKKAPQYSITPSWAKTPTPPPPPGPNATPEEIKKYEMMIMPKEAYKLPIAKAGISMVKGGEYSYLYDESLLFLVNAGIPTSYPYATNDDWQVTVGAQLYKSDHGYNFGFIYSHQELGNIVSDTYMVPMQKEIFDGQLTYVSNLVYKDSDQYFNPYYGFENDFIYELDEESEVRLIAAFDKDEAKVNNQAYSVTYSKLWQERFLVHLSAVRHNSPVFDESLMKLSIYMFLY